MGVREVDGAMNNFGTSHLYGFQQYFYLCAIEWGVVIGASNIIGSCDFRRVYFVRPSTIVQLAKSP